MRESREIESPSRYSIGIGHICLPGGYTDRDRFISQILKLERIPIVTEDNDFIPDAYIAEHVIDSLQFPESDGQFGSSLVYLNHPVFDRPIIVGVVSPMGRSGFNKEGSFSVGKSTKNGTSSIVGSAFDASMSIEVSEGAEPKSGIDQESIGCLNVMVRNAVEKAVMDIIVRGNISVSSESSDSAYGRIDIQSNHFDISSDEDTVVDSEKLISIGRENLESGVKGDKNAEILTDICDKLKTTVTKLETAIDKLLTYATTQTTASTPTPLTPLNAGYLTLKIALTTLKPEVTSIKADIDKINDKIPDTKSKLVKIE